MALPITINSGNPILQGTGVAGDNDQYSVTDSWITKAGDGKYYLVYSGVTNSFWYSIMLASATSLNGPWTRLGTIWTFNNLPASLKGITQTVVHGIADPFLVHDGTRWHMWGSALPIEASANWQTVGERVIPHFTNDAPATSVPLTGWVVENDRALVAKTTGYTSDGAGHPAGVSAPKVYPCDSGGWVMFFSAWGFRVPDPYSRSTGYALSDTLNGPWVISDEPIIWAGTADTQYYQAEQIAYFKRNGKHYMFVNRCALASKYATDTLGQWNFSTDMWVADSQLGPWSRDHYDAYPAQAWFGHRGVVTLVNDNSLTPRDTTYQLGEGAFSASMAVDANQFKIGVLTIAPTIIGAASTGGAVLGGAASVSSGISVTPQSGVRVGGTAAISRGTSVAGSGGLRLGGTATVVTVSVQIQSVTSTGGMILSGESIIESTRAPPSLPLKGPSGVFFPFHMKL